MAADALAMVQHAPRDLREQRFPLPEIGATMVCFLT